MSGLAGKTRGLVRLAAVLLIPWVLGWGYAIYTDQHEIQSDITALDMWNGAVSEQQRAGHVSNDYFDERKETLQWLSDARHDLSLHEEIAVGVPIALLIVSLAGFWVWRGFQTPT